MRSKINVQKPRGLVKWTRCYYPIREVVLGAPELIEI